MATCHGRESNPLPPNLESNALNSPPRCPYSILAECATILSKSVSQKRKTRAEPTQPPEDQSKPGRVDRAHETCPGCQLMSSYRPSHHLCIGVSCVSDGRTASSECVVKPPSGAGHRDHRVYKSD
ncbi:hypothetical protein ElyMa_004026500 [Elysia marginata]|uniref:Uncharacterized protein n=1 Tax=Elysia marginata TaxID=1093978 RepID=A0AAV4G1S1_9GAST|nr:hypothetical protein ElyMa_004026500 [Elysia marginata]